MNSSLFVICCHLLSTTAMLCAVCLVSQGHPWFGLGFLILALAMAPMPHKKGGRR